MDALSSIQTWLYDNLPLGVAIVRDDLSYLYVNAAYSATQGYATEQLLGQPLTRGQSDWVAVVMGMTDDVRKSGLPVEHYSVSLGYPRQPDLRKSWDVSVLPIRQGDVTDGFVIYLNDVTTCRQVDELHVSESRLRSVLTAAADAILVIDEDSHILQVNPAASRIFGYTEEELLGQRVEMIMPEPYATEHERYIRRYLHTNIPHIIGTVREVTGKRKDGSTFPGEISVAESRESEARRIFVGIIRDITERKEAEATFEQLHRRTDMILNAVGEGVYGMDRDGIITFLNPAAAAMLGYQVNELLGQHGHATIHHAHADGTPYPIELCPILTSAHDGTIHRVSDEVFWRKDGSSFDVQYVSTPVREFDEQVGVVVTFDDISESKRLAAELETARARLEAIINTVPLPLFVIDIHGSVSLANSAATAFYGESLARGEIYQSMRLYPESRQPWPAYEWPIVRALHEGRIIRDVEQLAVLDDGKEVPILIHAAPVIVDEQTIAAVSVTQDLTQLKEADRTKDAFLALITHELKTPLTAIISWVLLAREESDIIAEALEVILRSAQAQQRIINDLLELSRLMYGKLALDTTPLDAWAIASATADDLRILIEEREVTLLIEAPTMPLPVLADAVRLRQVISNLLVNAMKFTPGGGSITLEGTRDGDFARLRVIDTGAGITPEQLPLIFQRFQQLGREQRSGGLGLGLAVVKSLVELHGGRVEAASEGEDLGSTFTIWLPLHEVSDQQLPATGE